MLRGHFCLFLSVRFNNMMSVMKETSTMRLLLSFRGNEAKEKIPR